MTDNLRTHIAAVICGMDALHAKQWSLAVADTVIRELEADYILVPKSHTVARWIPAVVLMDCPGCGA